MLQDEEKAARSSSKKIDALLRDHSRMLQDEIKILLLGPGESGKSTIFKQMKILQEGGGYEKDELLSWAPVVISNTISQMRVLLNNAEKLGFKLDEKNHKKAEHIMDLPEGGDHFSDETADAIKSLWEDPAIKKTFEQRDKKFQLNDSAPYFFDTVMERASATWVPSENDVLRARVRSTGIEEAEFWFDDYLFRMFDVGGQRSERRKWIHCFECVTAVLFVVSLSEYDQVLREDETQNRMKESLLLFDEIVNSPWFSKVSFILFLNKMDLFQEKIKRSPLEDCFPTYDGGADFTAGSEFIRDRFMAQNQNPSHDVFTHLTCAIDSKQVETVFNAVRKTLLDEVLANVGF
mmetsp:Transcript_10331/g.15574  ORF Transcript_10331/g.15574 Transcript_10331/m.15574 type:complete len:349 (+) Transcript_10331:3-1049(+)